ncbi:MULTISPECIES: alpha/beta fold hydrolase [Sphingobacterium]|uniref:Alpha/beta fold hydrolase n=1 Tax=Sphingobacterium paramultivorum TaxID=2886510 RepID=A0A7G5DYS1_9SPHI|nr:MULTISPECIES: alpha/beta fold hydrolase [Sphingobacterium]MCS4163174.1 pimeloyl-ACP methyl ester carboxylesterase [Sphingobacterium sp. BIGb0116]QMV66896.1 alpha/beta fold hydrolase [Sphingobacterium paramultivorum]WET67680.1 MAG: alpha/beta fold hydrolase [Sphingobacterium sp.]WSO15728.1 alpha/beta fold hydrolase [Sphingobacterium paramultivorum]
MALKELQHSKIYGADNGGTPLIVLHGLFGMADNWGSFGRSFGEKRQVHLLDLRNHGRSFHSEDMSVEVMVEDLLAYITSIGADKVLLLGHSLGGKVAMQFAIDHPGKIEKLIIADIAPKAYPPHHEDIFDALSAVDITTLDNRKDVQVKIEHYLSDPGVIQFLLKNVYIREDRKLDWRFNLDVLKNKYTEFITVGVKSGIFNGPTLFLPGEKSRYILPEDKIKIREQFPNAVFKTIPNAGHWVQAENPQAFDAFVAEFLDQ